ncbi:patatin-like phospholipase family protein [Nocardia sp. NPDC052278]|uniref:patatin-like phospholipase family protein n=1 Tax=unclassified Nocardia TaxID=2637762 RepID=UPI00368F984A
MRTGESRAVVLGPGGVVGTAWLIGFLHGLRRAGIDLADADTIVGTSAGAIAAVVLTSGRDLADLATRAAQPESGPPGGDSEVVGQAMALARAAGDEPEERRRDELRRQIGRLAMAAAAGPARVHVDRMRDLVGASSWSHGGLRIPVIDVETGEPVVFTSADGLAPYLAAAASSAVPGLTTPVEINGRHYLDGGFRNGINADLVTGADTLVVIEPLGHLFPTSVANAEAHIVPDEASSAALGTDFADRTRWAACFEAGSAQAALVASAILDVW